MQPVLLYGAGREARSTRAFLKARAPQLKVYVTVDSGEADIDDAEIIAPTDLQRRHRAQQRFAHHRQVARRLALSSDLPRRPRSRHRRHLEPQPLGRVLSRRPHRHRHHRHQGQVDHRDARPPDADRSPASTPASPAMSASPRSRSPTSTRSSSSSSRATRPPTWRSRPTSPPSPISRPSTPTGTATSSATSPTSSTSSTATRRSPSASARPRRPIRSFSPPCATRRACCRRSRPSSPTASPRPSARSKLKGAHNLDNARLAAQIALAAGAGLEGIVRGINAFEPLPHRLEEHRIGGLIFVNDSISTTPEATKAALAAYPGQAHRAHRRRPRTPAGLHRARLAARAARRHDPRRAARSPAIASPPRPMPPHRRSKSSKPERCAPASRRSPPAATVSTP